jgi:hypothetical protein
LGQITAIIAGLPGRAAADVVPVTDVVSVTDVTPATATATATPATSADRDDPLHGYRAVITGAWRTGKLTELAMKHFACASWCRIVAVSVISGEAISTRGRSTTSVK